MSKSILPICLVLLLAAPAAVAGPTHAAAKRTAAKAAPTLTPSEKLALAWIGQMAAPAKTPAARARAATASRLFARLPKEHKRKPLTMALTVEPASVRVFAAGELARLGDQRVTRALLVRAVRDSSPAVRKAMARAAGSLRTRGAVHALAAALESHDEVVRRRAAEALGHLGDRDAMPYLIAKWEGRSGDFPRGYFAQTRQVSYIQDFDVEIA